MSMSEKLYFVRNLGATFTSIGAVLPTSRYAARAMAAECARLPGPKTILEAGAGTGAITTEIIPHIGPNDHLVLCELNPHYAAYLRQRIAHDPIFKRVRDRITLYEMSVTDLPDTWQFDCIISAIPFTSIPPAVTQAILARYQELLKPHGTFTYIEYAYLRTLKRLFASSAARRTADAINAILDRAIERHQFRRDLVWRNLPPAWIRHLRFRPPHPAHAQSLAPLEYAHRINIGPMTFAADAIPFAAGLVALALLLRRYLPYLWRWPLLLAALTTWFLRDPARQVIPNPNIAYAACDGRVLAVELVQDPRLGPGEWLRIVVFLSLFDVHINRAPIAGKVVQVFSVAGGYAAADQPAAEHNQACYTRIQGAPSDCVVVQRAGLVARRIVNWYQPEHLVAQGERLGLIRFGSRTDVYLPAGQVRATVAPGDVVRAGVTPIAVYTTDAATELAP